MGGLPPLCTLELADHSACKVSEGSLLSMCLTPSNPSPSGLFLKGCPLYSPHLIITLE